MALEVTSSTVSGLQKAAKPVESAPEQRAAVKTADVTNLTASAQSERQVVVRAEANHANPNDRHTSTGAEAEVQSTNAKRLQSAVNRANNTMKLSKTSCQFAYHEETNRVSIKILDKETNEVIREIPSEEALELVQKMWEMAGILVDERR